MLGNTLDVAQGPRGDAESLRDDAQGLVDSLHGPAMPAAVAESSGSLAPWTRRLMLGFSAVFTVVPTVKQTSKFQASQAQE